MLSINQAASKTNFLMAHFPPINIMDLKITLNKITKV
jgi:hypothetical protein